MLDNDLELESLDPDEIVRELDEEFGIEDEDEFNGFDIVEQRSAAEQEDLGTIVHIESAKGRPMYYIDRDGNKKPVTIKVAGSNSRRFREVEAQLRKRKLKPQDLTGELLYDDQIEKAAGCVIEWDGFLSKGRQAPFSVKNAKVLFKQCSWVLNQVVAAMNDRERFFSPNSTRR